MNLDILRFKINYNKVVHIGLSNQSIREIISIKVKSDAMFWSTLSDFYSPEFIVIGIKWRGVLPITHCSIGLNGVCSIIIWWLLKYFADVQDFWNSRIHLKSCFAAFSNCINHYMMFDEKIIYCRKDMICANINSIALKVIAKYYISRSLCFGNAVNLFI